MPTFKPNQPLRARELNDMVRYARSQSLQGASADTYNNGSGVVPRNPKYIRKTVAQRNVYNMTAPAVPCRTTGEGSVLDGFEVEVYGDGITRPYTHKDTMYILEIHAGAQIPANMWFLADVSVSQYLGGTN